MTNRDRDSAARLLLQVAERLRKAGADCWSCGQEAHAIESLVAEYLKPRPRVRGKR